MNKYLIIAILVLGAFVFVLWQQLDRATKHWETSEANAKAYASLFDSSKKQNVALQLTVDQLGYYKDSVLKELDITRKELKIKDKNLKALQAISSSFSRRDTITMRDTLFKEPSLAIDTVLGDKWYTLKVGLKYPSTIAISPEFKSEKHIIVHSKKETVNPPKKFFLFRWFQKRHLVIKVDVKEKNPYVNDEKSEYIEVIK